MKVGGGGEGSEPDGDFGKHVDHRGEAKDRSYRFGAPGRTRTSWGMWVRVVSTADEYETPTGN